jgi:Tol biopolymer transport system component
MSAFTLVLDCATLAAFTATSANATYSGRDGKIAFVRANQIYSMSATGTTVVKLTPSGKNYRPRWSPMANGSRTPTSPAAERRTSG